MKKLFAFLCLLALVASPLWSSTAQTMDGGYAGSFFQVPIGARPTAMGGAYLAVSNDGAGPLFNPAGLADLTYPLFGSSYRVMSLDRKLGYVTAMFPVRNQAVLGVHWLYAGSGSVTVRDDDGIDQGRSFSFNNHVIGVVFAKRFSDPIAAGIKINYLEASFPEVHASGVAFDFGGTLYVDELMDRENRDKLPIHDIRVALVVRHIGAEYRWNSEKYTTLYYGTPGAEQIDKIPADAGVGVSGRLFKNKLLLATDVVKNLEQTVSFHAGAEFFVTPELALRGGYGDKQFGVGTGYVIKIGSQALAIDYAFASDKVGAGSEHIFSFDLLFK